MQSTTRGSALSGGSAWHTHAHELALGPALVVEDQDQLREALSLTLEQHGLTVVACRDGQEALERLQMGLHPSVILLDLRTPRMSGWEFRLVQRENPLWRGIPVIALSADHSAQAAAIDATRFLRKPIERTTLLEAVDDVLRRSAACGEASAAEVSVADVALQATRPVASILQCLSLAQTLTQSLQTRLDKSDAFSLVGIRQLMARASSAAEHVCTLLDAARQPSLDQAGTPRNGNPAS